MKPHHHARGGHASPITRLLSVLLTILPVLLLITGFVLAAVSASSKEWSYRSYFNNPDQLTFVGYQYRSSFVSCTLEQITNANGAASNATSSTSSKGSSILAGWKEDCPRVRSPNGFCDFGAAAARIPSNVTLLCHHLSISARLLYAGNALAAASLLLVLILTAISVPSIARTASYYQPLSQSHSRFLPSRLRSDRHNHRLHHHAHTCPSTIPPNHTPTAYTSLLARILAALAAVALFTSLLVGTLALVPLHSFEGDFTASETGDGPTALNHAGPWLVGRAAGWCGAGAVLVGLAAWACGLVWDGPRVGVACGCAEREEEEGGESAAVERPDAL